LTVTTTTSTPEPDPYAVELLLAAALQQISDQQDAKITQAWAQAWGSVSSDLLDTLAVILADVGRVNAAAVVRYQRLASVLGAIADHLDDLTQHAGIVITSDLHEVVQRAEVGTRELIVAQKLLRDERHALPVRRVPSPAMRAIVHRTTEQVTSQLQPLADETYTTILRELTKGTAAGDNPRETARRMVARSEDLHNFGRSRALNIARTETISAYREGAAETQDQYPDLLAGWAWTAHLGPRTCPACLAKHGQVFPLDERGPDGHPQCRCARVPVVREADGSTDLSWLPNAEEHFNSLSPADQLAVMGPRRLELLKQGSITFEDLAVEQDNPGWRTSWVVRPVADLEKLARQRAA
jgi:SPP1 gp7 family putative phage head morphogenesis protein